MAVTNKLELVANKVVDNPIAAWMTLDIYKMYEHSN